MKNSIMSVSVVALLAVTGAAQAQWTGATLTDGNAVFAVPAGGTGTLPTSATAGGSTPTADFRTNGTTSNDNLFTNWWWVRVAGDTREFAISSGTGSSAPSRTLTGTNQVDYTGINLPPATAVNHANLRYSLRFIVTDLDGAGGAAAQVTSVLTVTNIGNTAVQGFTAFNYVDYFLNNQDANDIVPVGNAGVSGSDRYVIVNDTAAPGLAMAHIGLGASAYGVGSFTIVGAQFGDTGVDNFADANNGTVAGDLTGVMQWNIGEIRAGASVSVTGIVVIPTPGAAAFLGLGGLMASRRRRA